jgi:hypothetical protein
MDSTFASLDTALAAETPYTPYGNVYQRRRQLA